MNWYALSSPRAEQVAADLAADSVPVFYPKCKLVFWHPRKSVRVEREVALLPGYLLVGTRLLSAGTTRHRYSFLVGSGGEPVRVPDVEVLMLRCYRREFDVTPDTEVISVGTRVLVHLLGVVGVVDRKLRRAEYEVRLATGRVVSVSQPGLAIA